MDELIERTIEHYQDLTRQALDDNRKADAEQINADAATIIKLLLRGAEHTNTLYILKKTLEEL